VPNPWQFTGEAWDAQTVGQVANLSSSPVTILWRIPLLCGGTVGLQVLLRAWPFAVLCQRIHPVTRKL
jgi:hypothetical protein